MSAGAGMNEHRVLLLAPTARDGALTRDMLARADIGAECQGDLDALCSQLDHGAGAILVAEEMVARQRGNALIEWLSRQPPWSDLPVMVIARHGADSTTVARAMDLLGNVMVLERPTRVSELVSAVRAALRARQRQYQLRDQLEELKRAETALRDADRRKDDFLAMLAHELRNPLAPIRNSLQILRLAGPQEPATQQVSAVLERQVNHMVRLVDDLLEVSRITRGKIELRKERVTLQAVLLNAVEASRPLVDAGRHRLKIEQAVPPLDLEADPVRLAQVFSNLLNNAARYTEPGGDIAMWVRREGDWALVSVRDTGAGIPPAMLLRVFDLFTQVARPPGGPQGGLGIGLTLVKSLTEMHGGSVEARSEGLGCGSEFIVRLPLASAAPPAAVAATPAADGGALGHRILVMDDNRDAADSLAMLLGLLGGDVRVAYGGSEALQRLQEFTPTVVVLDIGMHEMDGHELARRLRALPAFAQLPLVALTGWGQEADRRRSREAGIDHHLTKPADLDALVALLRALPVKP